MIKRKEASKNNKGGKILIIVMSALIVLGGAAYLFRDIIKPILVSAIKTEDEIAKEISNSEQRLQDIIDKSENLSVRGISDDEKKALSEGSITEKELVKKITGKDENNAEEKQPKPLKLTPEEYNAELSELVAESLVLKTVFESKLTEIEEAARSEYKALPAEKRTTGAKANILSKYMDQAQQIEADCDAKIEQIIADTHALVEENGGDKTLPEQIKAEYYNQKALKKAYYISKLKK
jgi:hypothetical protein